MKERTSGQKVAQRDEQARIPHSTAPAKGAAVMPPVNRTGLPDQLKAGLEHLSGLAMDDVRVHYNSAKPAELQAFAYTQGTEIHVGPGQERHLPHEAWHVVQQKQGRVSATGQALGMAINDDRAQEAEADVMGAKAVAETRPAGVTGSALLRKQTAPTGVIQAKQYFNRNYQSLALPDSVGEGYRDYAIDSVIQVALDTLADDANLQDAITAINLAAQNDLTLAAQNLTLEWNGATVYLRDSAHNIRLDLLGSVEDDQNPNLYLTVDTGTASPLQVNKATGEERVLEAGDRYIPRNVYRSITVPERTALRGRNDLMPRVPGAGLSPLEHVAGGQNSQYSSYTRSEEDVVNSHGVPFNASGTGRVRIDLLNIAQNDILDLSTHEGIDYHLSESLPQNARDDFANISATAKTKAEDELTHGIVATAGSTNPHRAVLTDQRWQALVDAYRTQEVLIRGQVPFGAATNFGEFTDANHPLTALAQQGLATHAATSAQHSQVGQTALAAHRQATPALPALWQQDVNRIIDRLRSKKEEYLFKHKAQGVNNARQRNRTFRAALEGEFAAVVNEVRRVAWAIQSQANDQWANANRALLQAELTNRLAGWINRLRVIRP